MAENSTIEWTDATWNPITGCKIVSPGCTNCYAMGLAGTRLKHIPSRVGLTTETKAGPVWNGQVRLNEGWLTQPLLWRRPRKIFVCAHGDLFAEGVPDEWIDRVFAVMALAPWHTFQVLTKRAARMRAYLTRGPGGGKQDVRNHLAWYTVGDVLRLVAPDWTTEPINGKWRTRAIGACGTWPLPNVWLGVSAEDQRRADERVPDLLATPAAVRFVSAEPLIGAVDFSRWLAPATVHHHPDNVPSAHLDALVAAARKQIAPRLDWVIAGGESGPKARPMHPAWARQIRDACAAAGVAFHFKQHGAWATIDQGAGADQAGWEGARGLDDPVRRRRHGHPRRPLARRGGGRGRGDPRRQEGRWPPPRRAHP